MARLGDVAVKVRSKNAGPFWVTIDIFCGSAKAFDRVRAAITAERAAEVLQTPTQTLKRFEIPDLKVVKLSIPRPAVQGTVADRDMHGAALGALMAEVEI
ncbi:DUF4387 family protein [Pseudaestuariivita atlantica]|uniref:DUF4387 domain-containing protein n=1 Tax=Pseudaestuariivita atlantica TaxID=1317121 RepID=A0A0L1JPC7_9RHOB|nr:DUF4387 family protein [Pseudaestuariivita atlantica]KNG93268.1 hypothetical protein ATO11_12505 [Pseudaestuariivita atlantica]